MDLIAFLVPFVVTGIMFMFKKAAGLAWFVNGAEARPFLRVLLVGLSLIGLLSTSILTGKELDVDSVTALAKLGLLTLLSAYGSHWLYVFATFIRNWRDYL
jgi:hypothetical protein